MKKAIVFIAAAVLLALVYSFYNPVILNMPTDDGIAVRNSYKKGQTINVLKDFDFDSGKFSAYIILNERYEIADHMPQGKVFKTNNAALLKQMQQGLSFEYTDGDMATVDNEFLLFKDDKLVFRTGIVLDKNKQGFQNSSFGWIENNSKNKLSAYCSQFSVCFPIVML